MIAAWAWGWLSLPAAVALGVGCDALARAYVQRIDAGAPVDGATLCAALRAVLPHRLAFRSRRLASLTPCRPTAGYGLLRWPLRLSAMVAALLLVPAMLPFAVEPSITALARAAACAVLLVLALIDARSGLLPDALTLPLLWAGLLLAWAGIGPPLGDAVLAAALGYLFLRFLDVVFAFLRGHAGLGRGDMKLVAALGAWLGWAPLPGLLLGASLAGIVFALAWRGPPAWGSPLPFGPFLAAAGGLGLSGGPVVQFLF